MVEAANTSIGIRRAAAHNVKEAQSACLMQRPSGDRMRDERWLLGRESCFCVELLIVSRL